MLQNEFNLSLTLGLLNSIVNDRRASQPVMRLRTTRNSPRCAVSTTILTFPI